MTEGQRRWGEPRNILEEVKGLQVKFQALGVSLGNGALDTEDPLCGCYLGTAAGAAPGAGRWEPPGRASGLGDFVARGGAQRGR